MRRTRLALLVGAALLVALLVARYAFANVTVTAATGGTNVSADKAANATVPAWTTLGNVAISEPGSSKGDFAATGGTSKTLILTAPTNWAFNPGVGSVSFVSGKDITAASVTVAASTITVSVTVGGTGGADTLTISGIQVQPVDGAIVPSSGNILRKASNPGTATITGIVNDSTNFGSLSSVVGAVKRLAITSVNAGTNPTAGTAFAVAVASQDQFGNPANVVAATGVSLSRNTGSGTLGGTTTGTIAAGANAATISGVTYTAAESGVSLTATRTSGDSLVSGNSAAFTVNPGALNNFLVEAAGGGNIAAQSAGTSFNVRLTARDANNNTVTGFTGTADLSSTGTLSSGSGTTPAFTAGVLASRAVTISNTGSFTITATKTAGSETGTSNSFTVNPGALNNCLVEAAGGGNIATQTAGTSFNVKLTARDANNNTVTGLTGTADLSSTGTLSSGGGTTPAFSAGVLASRAVKISNTGSFTITATRTTGGTESGTSNAFTVNPDALDNFLVEAAGGGNIATQTAGSSFNVKLTARDANNNTVTGFAGTVDLSSTGTLSAGGGTTPAFTAGVLASRAVTISNTGSFTITATRTTGGTESGTSTAFTVNAGAAARLAITAVPATVAVGNAFSVTVQSQDANGNPANVVGTTAFSLSPSGSGSLTGNTGTIAAGTSSNTIATVAYDTPETITLVASRTSGDALAASSASSSIVVKDSPAAGFGFPGAGANLNSTSWAAGCAAPGLCGTVTDNSGTGIQGVDVSIRRGSGNYWDGSGFNSSGEVLLSASVAGANWSYAFGATSFPADGAYTVRVRARDNLGGVQSPLPTRTFTYDATAPTTVVSAPAAGAAYRAATWPHPAGTACDGASGLDKVEVSIRRVSNSLYWIGSAVADGTENWRTA